MSFKLLLNFLFKHYFCKFYTKSLYNDNNHFFEELKQENLESRIIYKKIKNISNYSKYLTRKIYQNVLNSVYKNIVHCSYTILIIL